MDQEWVELIEYAKLLRMSKDEVKKILRGGSQMIVRNIPATQRIIIEADYYETATIAAIIDNYVRANPDDEQMREVSRKIHNPEIIKGEGKL
ncbi:hypothetical protein [Lentibacillus salicampi]|uniref:Sin domain-containing protein n=1 Tax=Lentibacillus salicampi TaxID=175306 RepID=A0A4Y9ACN5_9BACI|nr:hypothetical protein [Lentibacillus salicampi]TFJ93639.1 hypothetical protein E4U82_06695 [Lentibacillus salicampi]